MITDDTRMVTREHTYEAHDGHKVKCIEVYGYELWGEPAEVILEKARAYYPDGDCQIMTFGEFVKRERELVLDRKVTEIDEETFDEMLNVLPPLKWVDRVCAAHNCYVNEFCMSEFDSGPYTAQYARAYIDGKTRYYCATVDYYDESTWIHNRL